MQDDYLMNLIRGLAGLAHWVATLGQRPAHHQEMADEAVTDGKLRAVTPRVLAVMSVPMILGLLTMGTPADDAVLHAACTLTDIALEQLDDTGLRQALHQRAVVLYDCGSRDDTTQLLPYREPATTSVSAIDALPLAPDVRTSVVWVLARLGHLAWAEDHLFELVDADAPAAFRVGQQLYATWTHLPDDALAWGGLQRDDLAQGLRDLYARTAS